MTLGYTYLPVNKVAMIDELDIEDEESSLQEDSEENQDKDQNDGEVDQANKKRGKVKFDDSMRKSGAQWKFQEDFEVGDPEVQQIKEKSSLPFFNDTVVQRLQRQKTKYIDSEEVQTEANASSDSEAGGDILDEDVKNQ